MKPSMTAPLVGLFLLGTSGTVPAQSGTADGATRTKKVQTKSADDTLKRAKADAARGETRTAFLGFREALQRMPSSASWQKRCEAKEGIADLLALLANWGSCP